MRGRSSPSTRRRPRGPEGRVPDARRRSTPRSPRRRSLRSPGRSGRARTPGRRRAARSAAGRRLPSGRASRARNPPAGAPRGPRWGGPRSPGAIRARASEARRPRGSRVPTRHTSRRAARPSGCRDRPGCRWRAGRPVPRRRGTTPGPPAQSAGGTSLAHYNEGRFGSAAPMPNPRRL